MIRRLLLLLEKRLHHHNNQFSCCARLRAYQRTASVNENSVWKLFRRSIEPQRYIAHLEFAEDVLVAEQAKFLVSQRQGSPAVLG